MCDVIKYQSILKASVLFLLGAMLVSCTWVKKTPEAERVRIVLIDRIVGCRKLGEVSAFTKDKVATVNRNAKKIQSEIEALAQIEAAQMGADTIVAATEIVNGRQSYFVYHCLN